MDGDAAGGEDETIRIGHLRERASVGLHIPDPAALHRLGADGVEQVPAFGQVRGLDGYA